MPEALEAIRLLRKELDVPLIGFAGAPFTLASYLVEGAPSRNHERTKALMLGDPRTWDALMRALVAVVVPHLRAQAAAGAQALQVFDSWVGALDADDYRTSVLPHMRAVFDALTDLDVPVIHFGVGTGELLGLLREAGGDVIGIDWRTPIDEAWHRIGGSANVAAQGNLDPGVLLAPWEAVERKAIAGPGASRWARRPRVQPGPRGVAHHAARDPGAPGRSGPRDHPARVDTGERGSGRGFRSRRCAGHGLRHGERARRHRALLHRHPRRPHAQPRRISRS